MSGTASDMVVWVAYAILNDTHVEGESAKEVDKIAWAGSVSESGTHVEGACGIWSGSGDG